MPSLFISHAVSDKPVVDEFFDLLQMGIKVDPDDTFCSSLEGMGIPGGTNFVEYIRGQIQDPDLILLMLSPNYMESTFCLCEMGAGWVMSHNVIPILIPPLDYSALDAVLTGINAFKIDSATKLTEFREQIVDVLKLGAPPVARWEVKRDKFLDKLPDLLKQIDPPEKVPLAEHKELQEKYDGAMDELKAADMEADELREQIDALKKCKDKEEVLAVELESTGEWEAFMQLCSEAKDCMKRLPSVVCDAIFHDMNGLEFAPDDYHWDDVVEASKDDQLEISDRDISLNHSDPNISDAVCALEKVRDFLGNEDSDDGPSEQFWTKYTEKYRHNPVFGNQRLWGKHLGL